MLGGAASQTSCGGTDSSSSAVEQIRLDSGAGVNALRSTVRHRRRIGQCSSIDYRPPVEYAEMYRSDQATELQAARFSKALREIRCGSLPVVWS